MKDEHNSLNVERQPGPLVAPLGGRVEQYYALDSEVPVSGTARLWNRFAVGGTAFHACSRHRSSSSLRKINGWLDDQPAMISRRVGNGRITYLGAVLDPDLMRKVVAWATSNAQVTARSSALCPGTSKSAVALMRITQSLCSSTTARSKCTSHCRLQCATSCTTAALFRISTWRRKAWLY